MESVRDVLQRRYVSRTLSARNARSRGASRRGDQDAAREQKVTEQQNVSACAEIAKIARPRDLPRHLRPARAGNRARGRDRGDP